jgi:hypothetical protein
MRPKRAARLILQSRLNRADVDRIAFAVCGSA